MDYLMDGWMDYLMDGLLDIHGLLDGSIDGLVIVHVGQFKHPAENLVGLTNYRSIGLSELNA